MNNTANKETYILDDSIAFELMDVKGHAKM
ncbi:DUF1655 domain-containing protein [Lactococcus lactis subsp. lactis]|nr:DUF1655 domain-containing protein [Lactococcus lactis]